MKFGTQTVLQGKSLDQFEMSLHGEPWGEKMMTFLWPPYGIPQTTIFLPCGFFYLLSSFLDCTLA